MKFRSIESVKKHYFPESWKKEQWDKMTPAEKGMEMAKETMEKFSEILIYH